MELGVEAADQLRAAIADMFEPLSRKQWEIEATSATQLVWVTDCDSSRSALVRPTMGKPTDKRLGITIASSPTGNLDAQRRDYRCTDGD